MKRGTKHSERTLALMRGRRKSDAERRSTHLCVRLTLPEMKHLRKLAAPARLAEYVRNLLRLAGLGR